MTVTADTVIRANRDGRPCPPWCITDHSEEFMGACVGTPRDAGSSWAAAVLARDLKSPHISVSGRADGISANLQLSVQDAEELALLAAMSGAGELAAAVRQAAADITQAAR